ncbi:hypothetical protein VTN02DRAFT_2482 [Thermoascus thermophilus]
MGRIGVMTFFSTSSKILERRLGGAMIRQPKFPISMEGSVDLPGNHRKCDRLVRVVHRSVRAVAIKRLHGQIISVDDIFLSNLDQRATIGTDPPRLVQKFAGEGVDDHIDPLPLRDLHDLGPEFLRSGGEDALGGYPELLHQELSFFIGADGGIDLRFCENTVPSFQTLLLTSAPTYWASRIEEIPTPPVAECINTD